MSIVTIILIVIAIFRHNFFHFGANKHINKSLYSYSRVHRHYKRSGPRHLISMKNALQGSYCIIDCGMPKTPFNREHRFNGLSFHRYILACSIKYHTIRWYGLHWYITFSLYVTVCNLLALIWNSFPCAIGEWSTWHGNVQLQILS